MDKITEFIKKNKWALIITVVGILYVLLMFEIGFWKTILLTIVGCVCCYIGSLIDHKNKDKFE